MKKPNSPFRHKYPDQDQRDVCQSCKNEDTDRLHNKLEITEKFGYFDHSRKFFYCFCCGHVWNYQSEIKSHKIQIVENNNENQTNC